MSDGDTVVLSPLNGIEMTDKSRTSHSVRNPIQTERHADWRDDMERAHYVVILRTKHEGWLRKEFLPRISLAGLQAMAFKDSTRTRIIVKIFACIDRLLEEADRIDRRLPLDAAALKKADIALNTKLQAQGLQFDPSSLKPLAASDLAIPDEELYTGSGNFDPYAYAYAPYQVPSDPKGHQLASLFHVDPDTGTVLDNKTCIQLLHNIIHAPTSVGGAGWDLERLKLGGAKRVLAFFPAHVSKLKERLRGKWFQWCVWPWETPSEEIRMYLGEEVGMYFSFLSFLTMTLVLPGLMGLATFIGQQSEQTLQLVWLPGVAIAVAIFAALFMEGWKRRQSMNALIWGMANFEEEEHLRAEYITSEDVLHRRSLINGKPEYWSSFVLQRMKMGFSASLITLTIGAVVGVVVGTFFARILLNDAENDGALPSGTGAGLGSFLNAVQIQLMSFFYKKLAKWLNDFENHPTETGYRDSLTLKRAVFEAVNSYFSMFWILLKATGRLKLMGKTQTCQENEDGESDCLNELQITIMVIFLTRLFVGNFQELAVPRLKRMYKVWKSERKGDKYGHSRGDRVVSEAEEDASKELPDVFEDYMEVLITYGYCVLFVVAFPLLPLLAMVSFYVELRVDALKFLDGSTRPIPRGAQDIGTWQTMFEAFGLLAIVTNLFLIMFTTDTFLGYTDIMDRVVALFISQYFLFAMKLIVDKAIPDVPFTVALQLKRHNYLLSKHFDGVPDEIVTVANLQAQDEEDEGAVDGVIGSGNRELPGDAARTSEITVTVDGEGEAAGGTAALGTRAWVRHMLSEWHVGDEQGEAKAILPVWGQYAPPAVRSPLAAGGKSSMTSAGGDSKEGALRSRH